MNPTPRSSPRERGSAILMAVFVLALLATMGVGLLFLGVTETRMSSGSVRLKQAFYLAEAGIEDGRTELFNINGGDDFSDELMFFSRNGVFELDVDRLGVVYDVDGVPVSLRGFGDDRPLRGLTRRGSGWYAAFVTNDPEEGEITVVDGNDTVMITGVGVGPDGSMEIAQAIVETWELLPSLPPATITLLGPPPLFEGGNSASHAYSGDDCGGNGDPNISVPIVGTIGDAAEEAAEAGLRRDEDDTSNGPSYESGGWEDEDTFANLLDAPNEPTLDDDIDPAWIDCQYVRSMIEAVRDFADVLCTDGDNCTLPDPAAISNLIMVDDDFEVGPPGGAGTLLVTGELRYDGKANWDGMIFVFGEGQFRQSGAGNGQISGAIMVADIAGPDNVYGTADDCTGGENGFHAASFDLNGGGNADTEYCSAHVFGAKPVPPYRILGFRQR